MLPDERRKVKRSLILSADLVEAIRTAARRRDTSESQIAREALRIGLRALGALHGRPTDK